MPAIWIPEYLTDAEVESSDDKTIRIDLPKGEQISHLQLDLSALGAATPRTTVTLIDEIDSYEVVADGSKVLYSLEPELAYYLDFVTNGGVYPRMSFNYTPNGRETHRFVIPFGRHLFDEDYLLDTSLYRNVQLRIKYTLNTARFQTGTFRHSVSMWRPLERLNPLGVIRSTVFAKETMAASVQTKSHKLPMTYPLRYLAARFDDIDQNIATDVTNIKVNIDEGRLILADLKTQEWQQADDKRFPAISQYILTPALSNGTTVKGHVDNPFPRASFSSGVRALIWKLSSSIGEQVALNVYEENGTVVTDSHAIQLHVGGAHPHKCLTLIDGRKLPFDVTKYTEGKVEYELAAYAQDVLTFGQEVVPGVLS